MGMGLYMRRNRTLVVLSMGWLKFKNRCTAVFSRPMRGGVIYFSIEEIEGCAALGRIECRYDTCTAGPHRERRSRWLILLRVDAAMRRCDAERLKFTT